MLNAGGHNVLWPHHLELECRFLLLMAVRCWSSCSRPVTNHAQGARSLQLVWFTQGDTLWLVWFTQGVSLTACLVHTGGLSCGFCRLQWMIVLPKIGVRVFRSAPFHGGF
jgi:hypothetical protein